MKKNFFKLSFIFAFVLFFAITGQAKADTETTTIRLQIKTNDASLYDREINVTACVDSLSASTTSVNALCALEQSGLAYGLGWYDDLAFLNSVGGYLNNDGENGIYWGWFENLNYSNLALNQYVLKSGDKILLAYNVNPLRISADNTSLFVGATSTITVEQFGLDASWSPVWLPAASSTLMIDGVEAENTSGVYKYKPLSAGEKIVYAKKDGYINSNNLAITAEELKVKTIRLQIKTHDVSLYDADIAVTACPDSDGSTTSTINVRCAIDQAGLTDPSDWAYGGTFLNSIKGLYASDYVNNIYWNWFSNLEYGQVAMTQHVLANGEKLLLTYNVNPLRISADNIAPYVNATSTITLEQFGLDASWNPAWYPAASSSLIIAGQEIENISGVYEYIATATAPVLIYGKKSGCIDSEEIIITAQEIAGNDNENNSSNNNQSSGGSVILPTATGGGATIVSLLKVDLGKAIDFLISKQAADGSFGSAIITDWAAIALSSINSNGLAAQKAKSYLLTDPNPLAGMNSVSDYSRRAMALMSLSISPYNGAKTNYIKKIIDLFDGQQFGDASLYNDDIFALLVLNKAGYKADDEIIKKTADFLIAKQQADGSWGGSDLTAAAIQALTPLSPLTGIAPALEEGRNFLFNVQGADGGFGNIYATAWVMQAIASLGEASGVWQKNNNTPESYLALSQGADGGFEKDNAYEANRVWSTAYVIPAVQAKPWFSIMQNFSKQNAPAPVEIPADSSNTVENEIASSSLEILDMATSSPEDLITATGMESSLKAEAEEAVAAETIEAAEVVAKPVNRAEIKVLGVAIIPSKTDIIADNGTENDQNQEVAPAENAPAGLNNFVQSPAKDDLKAANQLSKEKINDLARKILYVAGIGAIIMGLYLGLKLLRLLL